MSLLSANGTELRGDCRFCSLDREGSAKHFYDQQLIRTQKYFVVPSLGSFVSGWVLVVPSEHTLNLATKYQEPELVEIRRSAALVLKNAFQRTPRLFEHGAMSSKSQTGCGVDHAHLHLVPIEFSLQLSAKRYDPSLEWISAKASEIQDLTGGNEYLFYSDEALDPDPSGIVALVKHPSSQFFRQVLARELGIGKDYDYRSNYFEDNIRETQHCVSLQLIANEGVTPAVM